LDLSPSFASELLSPDSPMRLLVLLAETRLLGSRKFGDQR
jgi:hypothetical protein